MPHELSAKHCQVHDACRRYGQVEEDTADRPPRSCDRFVSEVSHVAHELPALGWSDSVVFLHFQKIGAMSRPVWPTAEECCAFREPNNRQSSSVGVGLYGSTGAGETWTYSGRRETQTIGRVVVHPEDQDTVWVAAVEHLVGANEDLGVFKPRPVAPPLP